MSTLQHENMILKQQVWDLATKLDPRFWEAVIRESYIEAAEKVDADIKDLKTRPSPEWLDEVRVYSKQRDQVKVLEKRLK